MVSNLLNILKMFTKSANVCFIKIRSKHSSNTLLSLLRIFMKQTLIANPLQGDPFETCSLAGIARKKFGTSVIVNNLST